MNSDKKYQQTLIRYFGNEIVSEDGGIDRVKLGNIVFSNPEKRKLLNKLSHPVIFRRIIVTLFKLKLMQRKPLVVLDAPLLFETKILEYFCYPILVVYCEDSQKQIQRLVERNTVSEEEAIKKISSQMPINIKVKKADVAIENGHGLKELNKKVINKVIPTIFYKLGYIDSL